MTGNEMVTNKLQDQMKYQEKIITLQQKTISDNCQLKKKKKIFIVGDFMIKNITGTGISKDHTLKIRPHPGATSSDMLNI